MLASFALVLLTLPGADDTDPVRYRDLPHTETRFAADSFETLASWQARRSRLRQQVRQSAGLWPELARTPLGARVFDRFDGDGFTVEKVVFESAPGLRVTGSLYRPIGSGGRRPAILSPHGHWSKGRLNHEEAGSIPARCITLARLGAIVFAYDMLGYNDSGRQISHGDAALTSPENELWSLGPFALQTWNSIRALDFLQSLSDVDPDRLGVTGASGGGTQTFILAAVDDRIQAACPVNMVSHTMQGGCPCENAPGLRLDANNMDIAALFAPKPMLMISASGDWTRDTPQVEHPFVRHIYALFDATDRLTNAHFDAPHNYNAASRAAMYPFFARWLMQRPDADRVRELPVEVPPAERLLVWSDDDPKPLTPAELFANLRRQVRDRLQEHRPVDAASRHRLAHLVRTSIDHAIGASFPGPEDVQLVLSRPANLRTVRRSGRSARLLRIGPHHKDTATTTLVFDSDGLKAAPRLESLAMLDNLGEVWVAEPFGTGSNTPPADSGRGSTRYFTTFNRTDDAETLLDIQALIASQLHDAAIEELCLVASGDPAPIVLCALASLPDKAFHGKSIRAALDLGGVDWSHDRTWLERLHIPNLRRVGGLPALLVTARGDLTVTGVHASLDLSWLQAGPTPAEQVGVVIHQEKADLPELLRRVLR